MNRFVMLAASVAAGLMAGSANATVLQLTVKGTISSLTEYPAGVLNPSDPSTGTPITFTASFDLDTGVAAGLPSSPYMTFQGANVVLTVGAWSYSYPTNGFRALNVALANNIYEWDAATQTTYQADRFGVGLAFDADLALSSPFTGLTGGYPYGGISFGAYAPIDAVSNNLVTAQTNLDAFTSYYFTFISGDGYSQKNFSASVQSATLAVQSVPEPATWAMMIVGFGAVGATMRSARRNRSMLSV